ncbi:hypothetical protein LAZ67_20001409, partial [Cordylochernes scorpioides]
MNREVKISIYRLKPAYILRTLDQPASSGDPIIPASREDPIIPASREDPIIPASREDSIIPASSEDPIGPSIRQGFGSWILRPLDYDTETIAWAVFDSQDREDFLVSLTNEETNHLSELLDRENPHNNSHLAAPAWRWEPAETGTLRFGFGFGCAVGEYPCVYECVW